MSDFTEFREDREVIDAAIIEASGRACQGLGEAIAGLGRLSLAADAVEMAIQLKYMSKSLGWMLREVNGRHAPSIDPPSGNGRATANRKGS